MKLEPLEDSKAIADACMAHIPMFLFTYHDGCYLPARVIDFGIGFPVLPVHCPHCGDVIKDYEPLRFDVFGGDRNG